MLCKEFYSINDPSEIHETLQTHIDSFVQDAYKNVPNVEELADRIKAYIRKEGCGDLKLNDIVETVAKQAGMRK